jgi:hypothetical protein
MADESRAIHEHFVRGVGESARHNSLAYGYSLALTGAFGVISVEVATTVIGVFLFGIGGALAFTIANPVVTRGFTTRVEREPPVVLSLGTSIGFIAVTAGIGAAALAAWLLPGWSAWLVGGFVASCGYLVVSALQFVLARGVIYVAGLSRMRER